MEIVATPGAYFGSIPGHTRKLLVDQGTSQPPGSVEYTQLVETFRGTFTREGATASYQADVVFDSQRVFQENMVGFARRGGPGGKRLSRRPPEAFHELYDNLYCVGADLVTAYGNPQARQLRGLPVQPGNPNFIAHDATQDIGDLYFDRARYQLNFATLPYKVESDTTAWGHVAGEMCRFVSRKTTYAAESFPVPSGSFRWAQGRQDAIQEGGVPRVFPTRELVYTWHEIPEAAMPALRAQIQRCIGRVNAGRFDRTAEGGGPGGYLEQTVLFLGAEERSGRRDSFGELYYDLIYRCLYRNNGTVPNAVAGFDDVAAGWNHLYRGPSFSPAFQLATSDGTAFGSRIYDTADLTRLFTVDPTGLGLGLGA